MASVCTVGLFLRAMSVSIQRDRGDTLSSDFQRDDGQCGQNDGHNPEADRDLRLMPCAMRPVAEDIATSLVELFGQHSEIVVNRRTLEDALTHSASFAQLEVFHLKNHAQTLDKEDAAKNGDEQFLMDDDGQNGNQSAKIGRASCRERV